MAEEETTFINIAGAEVRMEAGAVMIRFIGRDGKAVGAVVDVDFAVHLARACDLVAMGGRPAARVGLKPPSFEVMIGSRFMPVDVRQALLGMDPKKSTDNHGDG